MLIQAEVSTFLDRYRGQFARLSRAIYGELQDLKTLDFQSETIYRIYTREDKQVGGDLLKSDHGIAKKIQKWRHEGRRKDGHEWQLFDIHDIIGMTVVTYFQSDVLKVLNLLKSKKRFRSFQYVRHEDATREGYYALHVIVKGIGVSRERFLCEIQIKALLSDGWSTKTHDMTYKSKAKVDPHIQSIVNQIGSMLVPIEKLSETLRDAITRNIELDANRRKYAVKSLLTAASQVASNSHDKSKIIFKELQKELTYLSNCTESDSKLRKIMNQCSKGSIDDVSKCRLVVLLAANRATNDLSEMALDFVDEWAKAVSEEKRASALGHKAQYHWILGDFSGAVSAALELYNLPSTEIEKYRSGLDLAYYMAEHFYANADKATESQRESILKYLSQSLEVKEERLQKSLSDTRGAIMIMIAKTPRDVIDGQELCKAALDWARQSKTDEDIFEAFYELHNERANRQLQTLS